LSTGPVVSRDVVQIFLRDVCSDHFQQQSRVVKELFRFLVLLIASRSATLFEFADNVLRCGTRADRLAGRARELAALPCSTPDSLKLLIDDPELVPAWGDARAARLPHRRRDTVRGDGAMGRAVPARA
jgi:hypothetical protein